MSTPANGPAYLIRTERTVIRCMNPSDAYLLKEAVDSSLDHLRPWMPWAEHEPTDVGAKIALLRGWRGRFDLGQDFPYGIFDPEESRILGGTGLHTRSSPGALEIGYWIRVDCAGQGLATEVAAALTRVAFEVNQVGRVEIHCDAANSKSAAVPRKLGFTHEATLRQRLLGPGGELRDEMVWTMLRSEFDASPAARFSCEAYDCVGERIQYKDETDA
jgi:RimJ/RimL family protein N-acetyltransferase